jgi:hypothetical protein
MTLQVTEGMNLRGDFNDFGWRRISNLSDGHNYRMNIIYHFEDYEGSLSKMQRIGSGC